MRAVAAVSVLALSLAACGPKQVALPSDPVERAATCGVVAASKARMAVTDIKAPIPFDAQLGIVHYSLLAGVEGDGFSKERAAAVSKKMPELADAVTEGKWQELEQPCAAAFPPTVAKVDALPGGKAEQQLQCFVLADLLRTALAGSDAQYGEQMNQLGELRRTLDETLGARFAAKGQTEIEDQKGPKQQALAKIAKAGPPSQTLKLCLEKFAPKAA